MSEGDRRAPGATRIPFEAMVEVGGATGPAFEAQAVDVSLEGIHLRTAYLPEVGQPLTCRFDAGPREMVLASGEVVWSREASRGGEFGIRFSNLDADSARILGQMMCVSPPAPHEMDAGREAPPRRAGPGMKVRLHIEGLGSPMKARVKGMQQAELTVGSELGFLQVGKGLELENAETGKKRPAVIDRVEVQVDPGSQVPELVVALKYADEFSPMETAKTVRGVGPVVAPPADMRDARDVREVREVREEPREVLERADTMTAEAVVPPPPSDGGVDVEMSDTDPGDAEGDAPTAADRMKGAISRSAAKVTPAINAFAQRAKTTFALLAARKWRDQRDGREAKDDVGIPMRRVTAPPPGGGLHAEGRKVVRDFASLREGLEDKPAGLASLDKKKMILGGVAGALLILGAVAMRKPAAPPPAPEAAANEAPMASAAPAAPADSAAPAPNAAGAPGASGALANAPAPQPEAASAPNFADATPQREERRAPPPRRIAVAPFSNGAVSHGNVLRLRMDGAIEKLNGAAQPTGFTVVIPSRRSLEAAAPLAARDGRIASIKVVNDPAGAELSVTFKDGVPNYVVRAKGETLEIVLAPAGRMSAQDRLADAHDGREGHDSPRAHATPSNGGKRKHPAKKH
ncbi:PilZ domain-containing protein [Pendulispora rubella]|uniref:PilZ domain-containing protein n=1 Tax=Pendulispora rubella TaxID=2741070 RepID=A0ABZ2L3Q2_9BACT